MARTEMGPRRICLLQKNNSSNCPPAPGPAGIYRKKALLTPTSIKTFPLHPIKLLLVARQIFPVIELPGLFA